MNFVEIFVGENLFMDKNYNYRALGYNHQKINWRTAVSEQLSLKLM